MYVARTFLAWALALASAAWAQTEGTSGDAGEAPSDGALPEPIDERVAAIDKEIALLKKQQELLREQTSLENVRKELNTAEYPVATISNLRDGNATEFETTAFLANWALSTNLSSLLPDGLAVHCQVPTVVVDDPLFSARLTGARSIKATIAALNSEADAWLTAVQAAAPPKADDDQPGTNFESAAAAFGVAQSLVTQTLDLLKYFRTDIEFKPATVTMPPHALRSLVSGVCIDARIPEFAVPNEHPDSLLESYSRMSLNGGNLRRQLTEPQLSKIPDVLKAQGLGLLDSITSLQTRLSTAEGNKPIPIVDAAQLLEQADARQVLVVRVLNEGGTVYKRRNLFFLSPKISYVASISVDYVLSDITNGRVVWHHTATLKTQLNEQFGPWRDATAVGSYLRTVDAKTAR